MLTQEDIFSILTINTFLQHTEKKLHITHDGKQYDIFTVDLMGKAYSLELGENCIQLTSNEINGLIRQIRDSR